MTDEKPQNVIQAIARVMADMKGVGKDQRNKDQGYSFRGIEDVTATLQPVLGKHCVVIIPHEISHTQSETWTSKGGSLWRDGFIQVTYDIYGPGGVGDMVTAGPFLGIGRDNSDKGANKARSMAYKYMLTEVFCIGDKKDDADETTPPAEDPLVPEDMVNRFYVTAASAGCDEDEVAALVWSATEQRTADPHAMHQSEWPRLRDEFRKAKERRLAAPPFSGEGEPAPATEEASTGELPASEGAPPADPVAPEPQSAGVRGRARLGSKTAEQVAAFSDESS